MVSPAALDGERHRHRPGRAVQGELADGVGRDRLAVGRQLLEGDRLGQLEGGGRVGGGLHDPALEGVVAAVLVAGHLGQVDGEGAVVDLGGGDGQLAGDRAGAPDGFDILAEQDLLDPVARLGAVGHGPGAVQRPARGGGAGAGGRRGDLEPFGGVALDVVDVGERPADGQHQGQHRAGQHQPLAAPRPGPGPALGAGLLCLLHVAPPRTRASVWRVWVAKLGVS